MLKRLHYLLDVILSCARWYVAYPLSVRHIEEMMVGQGIPVDHSTSTSVGAQTVAGAGLSVPTLQACARQELEHGRECVTNTSESLWRCTEDGSMPPGAGLQKQASNRPVLLRSKGVVVSDRGKVIQKNGRYVLRR